MSTPAGSMATYCAADDDDEGEGDDEDNGVGVGAGYDRTDGLLSPYVLLCEGVDMAPKDS